MKRIASLFAAALLMLPAGGTLPLINFEHPADDSIPALTELEGISIAAEIEAPLTKLLSDARAAGLPVYLAAGYRDYDSQYYIFRREQALGVSYRDTVMTVGLPGCSEYGSGLSVDLTDVYRERKDSSFALTDTFLWLREHCADYGFILRWPEGKSEITGMHYVPWHFRYVGTEAAAEITQNGLTLEEYLSSQSVAVK